LQVESVRYNDTTPNGCSSATTHNNNKFLKQAIIVMPMSQKKLTSSQSNPKL
jgi:hypothetical protein